MGAGAGIYGWQRRDSHRMWRNRRQFIQYRFDALGDGGCIFWGVRDLAGGAMHQFALKFFTVGGLTIFRFGHGLLSVVPPSGRCGLMGLQSLDRIQDMNKNWHKLQQEALARRSEAWMAPHLAALECYAARVDFYRARVEEVKTRLYGTAEVSTDITGQPQCCHSHHQ